MYKKKIEQGRKVREKNNEEGVWRKRRRNQRCIGLDCGASLVDVKGRYSGRWGAVPGLSRAGDMLSGFTL